MNESGRERHSTHSKVSRRVRNRSLLFVMTLCAHQRLHRRRMSAGVLIEGCLGGLAGHQSDEGGAALVGAAFGNVFFVFHQLFDVPAGKGVAQDFFGVEVFDG